MLIHVKIDILNILNTLSHLNIMSRLEHIKELKQILNDLLIPAVIIDLIYSYARIPYELIFESTVPLEHEYYALDDDIFMCTHKNKCNTYKSILNPSIRYTEKYDGHNMLSIKHKLKDHGCSRLCYGAYSGCRFCKLYMNDRKCIRSLFPGKYRKMEIHHFTIYIDELYVSVQDSNAGTRYNQDAQMNIFMIDLQTHKSILVTKLSYGRIFVSKSYICTFNENTKIMYIYNKLTARRTNTKLDLDIIAHITDECIFSVHNYTTLRIRSFTNPDKILDEMSYTYMDFRSNIFYVAQRVSSKKMNMKIYNMI
jgi:hypothetical protein